METLIMGLLFVGPIIIILGADIIALRWLLRDFSKTTKEETNHATEKTDHLKSNRQSACGGQVINNKS